jgi:hypothetical protein
MAVKLIDDLNMNEHGMLRRCLALLHCARGGVALGGVAFDNEVYTLERKPIDSGDGT